VVPIERRIYQTMTTIESDDRGLLLACPQCGQRNRLIYERLGQIFRCGKCHAELRPPGGARLRDAIANSEEVLRAVFPVALMSTV
jgi:DNA-directed RNA polymerase subunit RPC12/RpoP